MKPEIGSVLVTVPMAAHHRAMLEAAAPGGTFTYSSPKEATDEQIRSANVLLGKVPPEKLKDAPNLRWMQLDSAGTDGYAGNALPEGVLLTNSTGAYGLAISEHLLAMAMLLMKKFHRYLRNQDRAVWHDEGDVTSMWGAKVLIVGLGDIGTEFATRCHALGARVTGIRRVPRPAPEGVEAVFGLDSLDELLPEADLVALCLPATGATQRLFDAARFARMKTGAILLNVGRGSVLDQDALSDALESGRLGGAGLDVTDPEPLPAEHRLWRAPNLLLTPHVSGFWHLPETRERIVRLMAENLARFATGEPLQSLVSRETGYRMVGVAEDAVHEPGIAANSVPENPCVIRVLAPEEADEMVRLRLIFTEAMHPEESEADRMRMRTDTEQWIRRHAADGSIVFMSGEANGEIVCFGSLLLQDLPPLFGAGDRPVGHVLNFYTVPQHRRKGYGRVLMSFMKDWASTHGFNRLSLHATADGAPLYRACGFDQADDAMEFFF